MNTRFFVRSHGRCACALLGVLLAVGVAGGCKDDAARGGDGGAARDAQLELPADELQLPLEDGIVRGEKVGEHARRFLQIPFAKPPVGALRWKAPVAPEPWTGVREQTEFAASCPQLADQGAPASTEEDCLYLNVWAPSPPTNKSPVMVWIHGGGNFSGGAGIPLPTTSRLWYDGTVFAAERGVLLVTLQYRLGPLGFFAHPALAAEGEPAGNQGLLDQRMALSWVRDNIAKFGGDPDNVTIFGESAGSADVCYHVVSPGSRGLFHRAVSQSGGCTIRTVGAEASAADTAASMVAYGQALGCAAGKQQLACMREVSVKDVLSHSMQPMPGGGEVQDPEWRFAAVLDGEDGFLPDRPAALFDRGELAHVPYLLGSNQDEGATFVVRATPLTSEAEYLADLEARFGKDAAAEVAAVYPPSAFGGDVNAARARAIGDSGLVCGTHDTARRAAAAGLPVFLYNFNVPWAIAPSLLHVGHAAEISHVFGSPHLPAADADSEAAGEGMNRYWARFAETGDPNGPELPAEWPAFAADTDLRLQLDAKWETLKDFRSEECTFWRGYHGVK